MTPRGVCNQFHRSHRLIKKLDISKTTTTTILPDVPAPIKLEHRPINEDGFKAHLSSRSSSLHWPAHRRLHLKPQSSDKGLMMIYLCLGYLLPCQMRPIDQPNRLFSLSFSLSMRYTISSWLNCSSSVDRLSELSYSRSSLGDTSASMSSSSNLPPTEQRGQRRA